jgi:metal-dependent HD superfamily phosphatase/phosphodiesterase
MITLDQIKKHPQIQAFIRATDNFIQQWGFTEHGFRHVNLVADISRNVAREVGFTKEDQELCSIAAYLHDTGNFIGRTWHHYWSSLLVYPILRELKMNPDDITVILNAITAHDKHDIKIVTKIAAVVILADKSDVHRSRVPKADIAHLDEDIHSRVNYAVTKSFLEVDNKQKRIILKITIDTKIVPLMEYFEIFTERMEFCRTAAEYLGYKFGLIINKTELL